MGDSYHHGVSVIEVNDGTRPIQTIETGIIGMVCVADDADETEFPLDTPVLKTNLQAALGKAGETGTLARSIQAIVDQANAATVIVRVAKGSTEAETTSKIIGTTTETGQNTGMQALLSAQSKIGVKPRILGVPGLDSQPVTTAMASIAKKLRAFQYASCWEAATKEDANTYATNFGERETMLIWPDFECWDVATSATAPAPAVARALGMRAMLDNEVGWHKTISNVEVEGVTGITKDIYWDLQDSATDSDYLNSHNITTLVHNNGYKFWGNRTRASDPLFEFENYTRSAQIVADTIALAQQWAVDGPLNPTLAKDIINSINAKFRWWVTNGYLVGGNAWLNPALNTKDTLKDGQLVIDYDFEPVPPLEHLTLRQQITDRYLLNFAAQVSGTR